MEVSIFDTSRFDTSLKMPQERGRRVHSDAHNIGVNFYEPRVGRVASSYIAGAAILLSTLEAQLRYTCSRSLGAVGYALQPNFPADGLDFTVPNCKM